MESDWSVTPLDGYDDVTLVTVDLRNPSSVDRRVRVSNRLDGPVLPPKRAGVPDSGWNEEGFGGVVPAEGRRTLGYACPAPARRPPVSVVDEGRADSEDVDATAAAVRELGDPRPPGDAIPRIESGDIGDHEAAGGPTAPPAAETAVPEAVESWLSTVESRIERGERLTDASVESATAALGDDDVSELARQVSADAAALEAVAERVAALEERASAVDVPVEALRRLS
jgi:hypothetical protein